MNGKGNLLALLSRVLQLVRTTRSFFFIFIWPYRGAQRLYRMGVHIQSLADGSAGKDYRKPQARIDWINNLIWLKEKYFNSYKSRFTWLGE